MSYAIKDDIKSLFRDFEDNADAAVDDADLDLFIANSTSIIDAKIGTLYALPITEGSNPKSFAILKQLQMFKVAAIVDPILNSYADASAKPAWEKNAKDLMDALVPPMNPKTCKQCSPTMKLPDAIYEGTEAQKSRIKVSATTGTVFKKGANNW